jgi:hypothetical protein
MLEEPWRIPASGRRQGVTEAKMSPEVLGPPAFESAFLNPDEGGLERMSKTAF